MIIHDKMYGIKLVIFHIYYNFPSEVMGLFKMN